MMWLITACIALLSTIQVVVAAPTNLTFDYIVVGSGAGGGPLASRLARAGFKTLLIEAGDDQGSNSNTTVPGYQALVTQDPKLRWDIYVNHYPTLARAQQDPKYCYDVGTDRPYVGLNPPSGAKPLGILYPRTGVLGGCVTHNALIWITPDASDWNNIASITGDSSWSATNMNQYLAKVYEWLSTEPTDPTILLSDLMLTQHLAGGAAVMGVGPDPLAAVTGLTKTLLVDPNAPIPGRDSQQGFFQIPLIMKNGVRDGVRDFVVDTVNKGYPLTVRTNCFVTKVTFDTSGSTPKATGVEFLDGAHLYHASPLSGSSGTPGQATANKEVILSGGTFNTVQLLKLSGIGDKNELSSFKIPVIKDLPGVGTNMQDRYEIPVTTKHPNNFSILDGCTFDQKPHDLCYQKWANNPYILAQKGAYASNGLAGAMVKRSSYASSSDVDLFIFGGPINFIGYFPWWGDYAVKDHQHFAWYTLKAHTRNHAGTVQLKSTNPLDTPLINFNYFDTGTTTDNADQLDAAALVEAIKTSRQALSRYYDYSILGGTNFTEELPGANVQSDADLTDYVKKVAWGHHACGTAQIGVQSNPNAVIDTNFKVFGVNGLRVVDASVFPRIPGIFIQAPILMVSEKAADVIINGK